MRAPKKVRENDEVISQELKDEKLKVMREALWNNKLSDEEANKIISDFNRKWIAAGGIEANSIISR